MMAPDHIEPVGFSDLTDDEALVIALFRNWRGIGPTQAIAEHTIARHFFRAQFHEVLGVLFSVFQFFGYGNGRQIADFDLLSEEEERLLDLLSDSRSGLLREPEAIVACRVALKAIAMSLRPASSITRSGRDRLLDRIDQTGRIWANGLAAKR